MDRPQEFWDKVIFSDISKFNLFGSDRRTMVWRKPNEEFNRKNTRVTVKHGGGSIMVWGCMAANGVGNLHFIDGIMDKHAYLNILKYNLAQSAAILGFEEDYLFQQDNDPKHSSYLVKEWLLYNVKTQLRTPPQSPDFNPIEHLWELLERRIRKHTITSKAALQNALQEEWNKISAGDTRKFVNSMRNCLQDIIKNKRYATKY